MPYVDGFIVAVKKERLSEYEAFARKAGEIWREHGALSYVECVADDVPMGELTSFPRAVKLEDDEIVIFSWIVYESRAQRDEVMRKVMDDARIDKDMSRMPFDGKRMIFGGFDVLIEL
jgi:uncharacterized protein YbaA (DUF1428 family)